MKLLLHTKKTFNKFLSHSLRTMKHYRLSIDRVEAAVLVTICFLLFIYSGNAATLANKSTTGPGSWTTGIWTPSGTPAGTDNVTVGHAVTLNANLSISALYTFNAAVTDATGGTLWGITVNSGGTLEINANTVIEGALNINSGGKLIIRSGATLTTGAASFTSGGSSSILIEDGGTLIVNGLFTNNNSNVEIDGDVQVNGKVSTGGSSAITGTGTVVTTVSGNGGTITNNGAIFGNTADCTSGTCSFISPCNAGATAPSISGADAVCTGASATLSAVVSPGVSSYQWQSSTNGTTFTNIATGGTSSTYTAGPTVATYYKLKVTYNSAAGGCSYTTTSSMLTVNTKSTVPIGSSGTSTICSGQSVAVGVSGGVMASDAVAAWYQGACPGFTEDWGGTSSPYTTMNGTTVNRVSGGYMNVTALAGTPTDPQISMFGLGNFDPSVYKYIKVRYRVNSGNPGNIQIYFIKNTPAALTAANAGAVVVSSALVTDGTWNIATIDMSQSSNWANNSVTGWRFDYATDVGNMDIDYIMLTAAATTTPVAPTTTTSYYVRYEGLCNSTACLGIPVTVTVKQTPTIATTTPASRCGVGSVALGATASAGTVNWYDGSGTSLTIGTSYTTPNLSATTTYYVDATNSGCTTASRTAVTATVNSCTLSWTGTLNNDWSLSSNWSPASVPTIIDDVTIPSLVASNRMPIISTNVNVKNLTTNGIVTITASGTLNVSGNITNTATVTVVSGSTVIFNGSSAQTMTGVHTLYNVQIANTSGGVSLLSALTVKGALTLTSGVLTTNSNLTINFDNGGNIAYNTSDAGSISGDVSGRRDLIARTHYISAPFSGVTSTQVDVKSPLYYNGYWKMYAKDFTTQGWTAVTTTTAGMPLGTGFSLAMPAAAPLILTGTYNHSSTYTGTSYSNAAAAKYILIGNPYPTALDWNAATGWTKTNVANAVYYWNASSNSVSSYVNGTGANGGTQYIPAMQSFMVTTTGGSGNSSVSIANAARVNLQNPSYFRAGSDGIIRIKLTGSNPDNWDDAVIRFNESATTSFDNDWDAYKIISRGPSPLIYTSLKGQTYSINSVSGVDSLPSIDVDIYIPSDGNYTLSIDNNDPTIDYILVDKKLGTDNQVTDAGYTFTGSATDDVNRFQLQLRTAQTTGTQSGKGTQGLNIYSSTKGFVIQTNQFGGEQADIEILDMTGNSVKIMSNSSISTGSTYVPMDLSAGAYLVKVTVDGSIFTGIISLIR
jgi:hypothetical protein